MKSEAECQELFNRIQKLQEQVREFLPENEDAAESLLQPMLVVLGLSASMHWLLDLPLPEDTFPVEDFLHHGEQAICEATQQTG